MWTDAHQTLLNRFAERFPPPVDDGRARAWTQTLAEQFAFTFPMQGWGTKSAGGGRPPSTDVICTRTPFVGYDVLTGQGTSAQAIAQRPGALDLTGQTFIAVTATNHLGPAGPPPQPPPMPVYPPYPGDVSFDAVGVLLFADYAEAGQGPNPLMGRWFGRTMHDWLVKNEPTLDASVAKHRKEWRAALGLP